jgi:hypothetical protein
MPKVEKTAEVYTCAFRSSDCCQAPIYRICFAGDVPDRYVCRACHAECSPVEDRGRLLGEL